jgi:hypothetical protein
MGELAMSAGDLPGALQHFQAARRMGEHLHQGPSKRGPASAARACGSHSAS